MSKKNQNIADQPIEELVQMAATLEKEIFALRNELAVQRKLEKPHLLKAKRKDRARLLTVLTQKEKRAHG